MVMIATIEITLFTMETLQLLKLFRELGVCLVLQEKKHLV